MLTFPQLAADKGVASEQETLGYPVALKYLRDRGIEGDILDALGIKIFPANYLLSRAKGSNAHDDRLAIVIPHFDTKGEYIDWWSARLVDCGLRKVASFANLVPHKRGKMFCPPNEAPHAYLPPTLDWQRLTNGAHVHIHESCLKAANGAKLGHYSVGLNGVWGWTSRKNGIGLVQELRDLPWKTLNLLPVVVFDSNTADNWDVQAAMGRLAATLLEFTGQRAAYIPLPKSDDDKHWGFDDFVAHHGAAAANALLSTEPIQIGVSELELLKLRLNDEVCVVRSMSRVADQETATLMSRGAFVDLNYAHYSALVGEKTVNVPRIWLTDPSRSEVEALTYAPGQPRVCGDNLNVWRGMGIDPAPGDAGLWLRLVEDNCPDEDLRRWLLQWLAYPLQNLGCKMNTYVHLYGPPGSGKQALLAPLIQIYGVNGIVIGKREIASDFNSVYANKQFINIDEIHGGNEQDAGVVANRIKMLATSTHMVINTKGAPEYSVPNVCNFVTTANYADAIRLDDDDRRACVLQWGKRGTGEQAACWQRYFGWIENENGSAAVYDYLLNFDLTGFDPKGWAPVTQAKLDVTHSTRKVDEQWVNALWSNPAEVLPPVLKGRCLMTSEELAQYCYQEDPYGVTPGKRNLLGVRMASAGFDRVELKIGVRKARFWIIDKKSEKWPLPKAREHLRAFGYPGIGTA